MSKIPSEKVIGDIVKHVSDMPLGSFTEKERRLVQAGYEVGFDVAEKLTTERLAQVLKRLASHWTTSPSVAGDVFVDPLGRRSFTAEVERLATEGSARVSMSEALKREPSTPVERAQAASAKEAELQDMLRSQVGPLGGKT